MLPIILISGPTASGKSDFAIKLSEAFSKLSINSAIINADSVQLYKDIPILSAQPSACDQARAAHQLFGVLSAADQCNAFRWAEMAHDQIHKNFKQGIVSILVGGTGLYFKSLLFGLDEFPEIDAKFFTQAQGLYESLGKDLFVADLLKLDSQLQDTHFHDPQRMIRAWAIKTATGKSIIDYHRYNKNASYQPFSFVFLPDRQWLYKRCNLRFDIMLRQGALQECAYILWQRPQKLTTAHKAVGVEEFAGYFYGNASLDAAVEKAKQRTRHYAKRQFTWMRNQLIPSLKEFPLNIIESIDTSPTADVYADNIMPQLQVAFG